MDTGSLYSVDITAGVTSTSSHKDNKNDNDNFEPDIEIISALRRVSPRLLGSLAKNLMMLNIGQFAGFSTLVIPSLMGFSKDLNPNETVQITAAQASWLSGCASIAHPIGSLFSGPINDKIGRRKAIMLVNIPITVCWIALGLSQSFLQICVLFTLLGFNFGLKEAPSFTYISEICEPSVRRSMMIIANLSFSVGIFIVIGFGSMLPWRQVSFICALFPIACLTAVLFVPESPSWLLSKGRRQEALQSLQWLRGWTLPQTVRQEFVELQNYSSKSNACVTCAKLMLRCKHPKPTFCDKIKQLKRRQNILPLILVIGLQCLNEFNGPHVMRPYMIQVLNALGTPIQANLVTVFISGFGIFGCIIQMLALKSLGKRRIYLIAILVLAVSCFGLSIYGFVLLPFGWKSLEIQSNESTRDLKTRAGNYSYLALSLIATMVICTRSGVDSMSFMYVNEVFPLKLRSFLCGISLAIHNLLSSIATKTFYNAEMWLSLPGAILFYGGISFIGFIVMFFIMPETEGRSLEDIELHYSDKSNRLTDIFIRKSFNDNDNKKRYTSKL